MNRIELLYFKWRGAHAKTVPEGLDTYSAGYERALADVDVILNDWIDRELSVGELAMAIAKLRGTQETKKDMIHRIAEMPAISKALKYLEDK